jgi:hypothetical protein
MKFKQISTVLRIIFSELVILCAISPASGQISPGKLSTAHQSLEGIANCTKCHQLKAEVTAAKCLECHKSLAEKIGQKRGYHASSDIVNQNCSSCHREHNGRDFDLVYWPQGQKSFDHSTTGYRLEGAHADRDCRACHKQPFMRSGTTPPDKTINPAKTFLGLNQECLSCHAREHLQQLTDRCLDCHIYTAWTPATKYKHDQAKYKLTGKHVQVACAKCHHSRQRTEAIAAGLIAKKVNADSCVQYQGLTYGKCSDCHKDVHQGRLGTDCVGCHTTEGFKTGIRTAGFDHSRTAYPLKGKHLQVVCNRCHSSGDMTKPLAFGKCRDCHSEEHGNIFAARPDSGKCDACHTIEGYTPANFTLEAHQQSRYPLTGSHLAVPCNQCHVPVKNKNGRLVANFDLKYTDCANCHKDVHQGQVNLWVEKGGCAFCHKTDTWHQTFFDHSQAKFVLDGKHREILCLKCHYTQIDGVGKQVWMKPLARDCSGCHEDKHRGQFLKSGDAVVSCEKCHKSSGWKDLKFSHNQDAQFALDGAHQKVACGGCHKPALIKDQLTELYRPLAHQCTDCHKPVEKSAQE